MNKVIDLSGQRFGRFIVLHRDGYTSSGNVKWLCRCDCGTEKIVASGALRSGTTVSCGCYIREKTSERSRIHSETKSRLHRIWTSMKTRCSNPRAINYSNYGGRGIRVCSEWSEQYLAFRFWAISNGYTNDMTIDRKDNDGDYTPENCQWISRFDQQSNKRNNRILMINGDSKTVTEWGRLYNIDPQAIWARLNRGWNEPDAVMTPSGGKINA